MFKMSCLSIVHMILCLHLHLPFIYKSTMYIPRAECTYSNPNDD